MYTFDDFNRDVSELPRGSWSTRTVLGSALGITCNSMPVATLSDALNNTEQSALAAVLVNLTMFADRIPETGSKGSKVIVDSEAIWELITKEVGDLLDMHPSIAKEFEEKLLVLLPRIKLKK